MRFSLTAPHPTFDTRWVEWAPTHPVAPFSLSSHPWKNFLADEVLLCLPGSSKISKDDGEWALEKLLKESCFNLHEGDIACIPSQWATGVWDYLKAYCRSISRGEDILEVEGNLLIVDNDDFSSQEEARILAKRTFEDGRLQIMYAEEAGSGASWLGGVLSAYPYWREIIGKVSWEGGGAEEQLIVPLLHAPGSLWNGKPF